MIELCRLIVSNVNYTVGISLQLIKLEFFRNETKVLISHMWVRG